VIIKKTKLTHLWPNRLSQTVSKTKAPSQIITQQMIHRLTMRRFVTVTMRRRMRRRLCVSYNTVVSSLYGWHSRQGEIYTNDV
jgi:hypothetical protein